MSTLSDNTLVASRIQHSLEHEPLLATTADDLIIIAYADGFIRIHPLTTCPLVSTSSSLRDFETVIVFFAPPSP